MFDRQNCRPLDRPAGSDCGREVVELFPVLAGGDFYTSRSRCVWRFRKTLFVGPSSEN